VKRYLVVVENKVDADRSPLKRSVGPEQLSGMGV
jgi:hypothetical protein